MSPATLIRAALGATLCLNLAPAQSADWLVVSGASYHFENRDEYRADNPGIGWEHPDPEIPVVWTAGYYRNSYDRDTFYAGGRWMPIEMGSHAKLGAFVALASGYWTPVVAIPTLSLEYESVGLNLVALPTFREYSGYIGLQLRFRVR